MISRNSFDWAKGLKPIETRYNGYFFRSRQEARWAVFLDEMRIPYRYEIEGFDFGNEIHYLPDFWLPETKTWLEIKGNMPNEDEILKATLLAQNGKCNVVITWCDFDPRSITPYAIDIPEMMFLGRDRRGVFSSLSGVGWTAIMRDNGGEFGWLMIKRAFEKARAARFDGKGKT